MRLVSSASCEEAQSKAVKFIVEELEQKTSASKNALWLLSGGSSIAVATAAAKELDLKSTKQITVAQVDERFVPPGSEQENWQQLINAGLNPDNFKRTISILSCGNSLKSAAETYANILKDLLESADYAVALFGVGTDGHTAGIKPTPDPKTFASFVGPSLAVGYQADDFARITITAEALKQLDSGTVYACGQDKKAVIKQLETELPPHVQPAQLLKSIPTLVIFN